MNKDVAKLIRELNRQDFEVRTTRRGHHLITKNGVVVAGLPGTPSDWRSLRNSLADLRRAGFIHTKFA